MNLTAIVMASILVAVKQKKKSKKKKEPDPTTLSSSHLMAMVASLALLRGLYPLSNGVSGNESTAIKDGSHQGESAAVVDVSLKDKITTVEDKIATLEDKVTTVEDKVTTVEDKNTTVEDKITTVEDGSHKDKNTTVEDGSHGNNSTSIKEGSYEGAAIDDASVSEVSGVEVNVVTRTDVSTDKECPREETEEGAVGGSLGHTKGLCDRNCE